MLPGVKIQYAFLLKQKLFTVSFFFPQGDTFTGTMSIILGRKHGDYIWKKCQKMKLNHIVSLGFFPYSRGKTALLRKLLPAEGISFHNSVVVRHIWNGVHEKKNKTKEFANTIPI